jgi:hypothetical protein
MVFHVWQSNVNQLPLHDYIYNTFRQRGLVETSQQKEKLEKIY